MKSRLHNPNYWQHVLEHRRQLHSVSGKQLITGQVFTIIVSAGAGILLYQNESSFVLVGGTLILYPGLIALLSSNAASLSASIHHELDTDKTRRIVFYSKHLLNSLVITFLASLVLGLFAGIIGELFFDIALWRLLSLSVITASIGGIIGFPIMILAVHIARLRKTNPDDVSMPIESTLFALVVVVSIIFLAKRLLI